MHYAWLNSIQITYIATGSAVVSPPCQSVERLFTLHTHRHFIVADPARGSLTQLCVLYYNKKHAQCDCAERCRLFNCVYSFNVTLTDTSSTSFNAFLNDSFFCWKISMVSWKAWRTKKHVWFYIDLQTHIIKSEKNVIVLCVPLSSLPCPALSWGGKIKPEKALKCI